MTSRYRRQFDINPDDLEIIESALQNKARALSLQLLEKRPPGSYPDGASADDGLNAEMSRIQLLLGKLHNQKIWYSPKQYVPRG